MKMSKACVNLVKEHEGYHKRLPDGSCTTYYCPAGVLTIGFGCTVGIKEGDIWSPQQAVEALRRELEKHEKAVNGLIKVDITQNQFDALVSFSYNCGSGALAKSSLLKRLNKGDFAGAAAEFHKWNKGGGRVLPGLVRRRAQEAELFLTPDASNEPVMPQAVDAPAPVKEALRTSRTIFSTLSAAGALLAYVYHEAIEITLAAAAQFDTLAPIGKLLAAMGVSVAGVALVTACVALAGPILARLDAAAKGKTG